MLLCNYQAAERFGRSVPRSSISSANKSSNIILHNNNLLYINGTERALTWMNAVEDNLPITPRTGYVVEINALWYNALKFVAI